VSSLSRSLISISFAIVVAVGVIVASTSLWFQSAVYGDRSRPAAVTRVLIPAGSTFAEATNLLDRAGVLAHPWAFRLLARIRQNEGEIAAGEYRIPANSTSDEILRRLVDGAVDAKWVTFPEGFTAKEMAARLGRASLADAAAFTRYAQTTGIVLGGVRTPSLEGYLFPSTYLVPVDTPVDRIAAIFVSQFRAALPPDATARARALGRTVPEVITIASLIEREAKADDERALMAGVYYNRLRAGMPLDVDATIEYIFPEHHDVITRRDLAIDSPYNTYRHRGLPPTPIANPGKASIDAAFAPRPSPYLYYVYKGDGHHAFATTLREHEANVERYLRE
jgi:UPF0755 protein